MKKLLISCLLALTTTAMADTARKGVTTLTKTNHVALIGEVDEVIITDVILQLEAIKEKTAYIFIDSPGGSVMAGQRLIQYIITSDKKIICVAKMAISMAHQILQHCPYRVATPDNILMQHRMTAGAGGNVDEMAGLTSVLREMEIQLNTVSARRIGVSLEEFFKKVNVQWWTYGKKSKETNMVDEISHVKCSNELYAGEIHKDIVIMGLFKIPVIQNTCPLIPLRVDMEKLKGASDADVKKAKNLLEESLRPIARP